jgi:hypothetical protein
MTMPRFLECLNSPQFGPLLFLLLSVRGRIVRTGTSATPAAAPDGQYRYLGV